MHNRIFFETNAVSLLLGAFLNFRNGRLLWALLLLPLSVLSTNGESLRDDFKEHYQGRQTVYLPGIDTTVDLDIYHDRARSNDPENRITTFVHPSKGMTPFPADKLPARVVVYMMNGNYPRIGKESDRSIISDLLEEGYIVAVADFKNHPLAFSPRFDHDLNIIYKQIYGHGYPSLLEPLNLIPHKYNCYFLPAGYRIARDLEFWNIREHGAPAGMDHILTTYNRDIQKKFDTQPVNSVEEITGKDGKPLDSEFYRMRMDIIYPSDPEAPVPLICNFSSAHSRDLNGSPGEMRMHMAGFAQRGYAVAIIDHCFNPVTYEYGYIHPYTLDQFNGLAANSAAIRYLRIHSDQYGINSGKIGVWGHSKAAYAVTRLSDPEHESATEHIVRGAPLPPQPWPGVSSKVNVGYQAMGWGTTLYEYVTADNIPTIIAVGEHDQFGCYKDWPDLVNAYEKNGPRHIALEMLGMGHTWPSGYDDKLSTDRYDIVHRFFDAYLKPQEEPTVLYVTRQGGEVIVHFAPDIDAETIPAGVEIRSSKNNTVLTGTWKASLHNTRFHFKPDIPLDGEIIVRLLPELEDMNGDSLREEKTFVR